MNLTQLTEATSNWNKLVNLLTHIFKFENIENGTVKRVNQGFDKSTGEHVIVLEYRVRLANQAPIKTSNEKVKLTPDDK